MSEVGIDPGQHRPQGLAQVPAVEHDAVGGAFLDRHPHLRGRSRPSGKSIPTRRW